MIGGSEGTKERGSRGKTDDKKSHSGKTILRRRLQRNINEELTVENLLCREGKKKNQQMRQYPTQWVKILAKCTSNKELVSRAISIHSMHTSAYMRTF